MKTLAVTGLEKTYGTKTLLAGIDFAIRTGDRIGLIGPNGTGKSSFLKVLADQTDYDQGTIDKPKDYRIAYLAQNPELDPNQTILDTVFAGDTPELKLLHDYEAANLALLSDPDNGKLQEAFQSITEAMNQADAWQIEVKAKTVLTQLGLVNLNQRVGDCSGGEQKRIGIAQVLIAEPDLLILDEPTNHLDVNSVQWLEKYLASYKGALLLVTHDRYFLERTVNKIVELRHGRFREYSGNYQAYLEKKATELALEERMQDKQDKLYQAELAWMRKGAKARTTKQQARIERFDQLKEDIAARQDSLEASGFEFDQQRIGNQVIELEQARIEVGQQVVIQDYTKHFTKGERIGLIGANGVGKTTFLNTLAGYHDLAAGTLKLGQTVRLAYYRQLDQDLPGDMRILSYLTQIADNFVSPDGRTKSAAQILEQFNFPRVNHGSTISSLSGGEKRRLYLLSLLIQEPNVLFLDEPTNDLDIDTLTVLEDYLAQFEGLVVVVSHDRYFLDKTVDQYLILEGQGAYTTYWGSYSDYLAKEQTVPEKEKIAPAPSNKPKREQKKLSYEEKKEWAGIEAAIEDAENRLNQIQEDMEANSQDAGQLMSLQAELEATEAHLYHLYERYDYLSELAP
ncbi:ABC-F family ATP-binding cassette domain-containing protein [Abiotrophia defectiva]|uniref:ABC transporter, ATP-binding protein n=2 Tax=Abiotrophia defectiva TaxID=46125 RepID=W1Q4Y8_ABIDE|nr:ABC-F family ATP-binding cassette domain-containing protein [Abiotrophia defectiva]ESK66333.1 ABC transporter, ATP-binding protein [Abiotrophia defectiva ATCC 49176]QKH47796.1 ABC-F family ATP-binding cassette domain-containing protein [Abiotrophia defectiva]